MQGEAPMNCGTGAKGPLVVAPPRCFPAILRKNQYPHGTIFKPTVKMYMFTAGKRNGKNPVPALPPTDEQQGMLPSSPSGASLSQKPAIRRIVLKCQCGVLSDWRL